jgi:hypothetical protein
MECDHEWRQSPFGLEIRKRKGLALAEHAMMAIEVCAKCGVLRIDPKRVPELAPR